MALYLKGKEIPEPDVARMVHAERQKLITIQHKLRALCKDIEERYHEAGLSDEQVEALKTKDESCPLYWLLEAKAAAQEARTQAAHDLAEREKWHEKLFGEGG